VFLRLVSILRLIFTFSNLSREAREQAELAKIRAEKPKLQQKFSDLKRGLAAVTDEEWDGIPEAGNLTKKKRRREERSFIVPDSILVGDRSQTEFQNSLDARQQQVASLHFKLFILFIIIADRGI